MKTSDDKKAATSVDVPRLVLPLWAEYGEGPPKCGDYNIRIRAKDGREKEIAAWHNPGNGHWLVGSKECGYVDIIQPPGETEEWRITHWQNARAVTPGAIEKPLK